MKLFLLIFFFLSCTAFAQFSDSLKLQAIQSEYYKDSLDADINSKTLYKLLVEYTEICCCPNPNSPQLKALEYHINSVGDLLIKNMNSFYDYTGTQYKDCKINTDSFKVCKPINIDSNEYFSFLKKLSIDYAVIIAEIKKCK